jgi:anti-sigma regulatory factor (Ser/Thr protein kinase)|tara:strand:+ start:904 stop:1524 length:621 start_codon:yes stop_codon:yes gene_type:complete
MKIYLDKHTHYNVDNLKHRYKCLEDIQVKEFEMNLLDKVSDDIENIYCQLVAKETISFYIRSPQQICYIAEQIAKDFNSNPFTLRLSLSELLMNSLEHGNLNIDSNTKNTMISAGNYYDLLEHLVESNNDKYITLEYKMDNPKSIIIKDQGEGFCYQHYIKSSDDLDENSTYSGRGIQIASIELPKNKASFEYLEDGTKLKIKFKA